MSTSNHFSKADSDALYVTIAPMRGAPWPPRALAYKVTKDGLLVDLQAPHSAGYSAQGFLLRSDAACDLSGQIGFSFNGGEFTLTAVDDSHVAGKLDVQLIYLDFTKGPQTRHVAGTFDAPVCRAPNADLESPKCCLP